MRGTRNYKIRGQGSRAHALLAPMLVIRRVTALLAMLAIVGLILLLMWDVYLHHSSSDDSSSAAVLNRAA